MAGRKKSNKEKEKDKGKMVKTTVQSKKTSTAKRARPHNSTRSVMIIDRSDRGPTPPMQQRTITDIRARAVVPAQVPLQTPQADDEEFDSEDVLDSESESIGSASDEERMPLRQSQIAFMQTLGGASTLDTDVVKERGLKKQRVLGLGSLDQALPLLQVGPPPSCSSMVSGMDPAFREEINSMRARELQLDEEVRQLREQLQAQIRAREEEAAEARRRQEVHEKELAEMMERIRMIEQFIRSSAQILLPTPVGTTSTDAAQLTLPTQLPLTPADAPPTFRPVEASHSCRPF